MENVVVDGSTASKWKGCLRGGLVSILSCGNKKGNPDSQKTNESTLKATRARAWRVPLFVMERLGHRSSIHDKSGKDQC